MTTTKLPGPWPADEAPGPTCHLGSTPTVDTAAGTQLDDLGTKLGLMREWQTDAKYRERILAAVAGSASCSLVPSTGACDAHRAQERMVVVLRESLTQVGLESAAAIRDRDAAVVNAGRITAACRSLHRAWKQERESGVKAVLRVCEDRRQRVEAAEKRAKDAEHAFEMYANAWHRELGAPIVPKRHHIDAMVLTTRERVQALKAAQEDNARLRAELAALVQVAAKLREDLDRLGGQALDLGRDTGRVHRALDEAQVPKANPDPGRPWRIDDRVVWALERLKTTGELVDNLEGQLAETGAELADVRHQLQRLQLSACRLVAVNGGRA